MVDLQPVDFLIVAWQKVALLIRLSTVITALQVFVEISRELGFLIPLFDIAAYVGADANGFAIHCSVSPMDISIMVNLPSREAHQEGPWAWKKSCNRW